MLGDAYRIELLKRLELKMLSLSPMCVAKAAKRTPDSVQYSCCAISSSWRPIVTVPYESFDNPTYAHRPNILPPCPSEPFVELKPFSSMKIAAFPPPKSSRPLKPTRGNCSGPLAIDT